jgi:hypothetical protein
MRSIVKKFVLTALLGYVCIGHICAIPLKILLVDRYSRKNGVYQIDHRVTYDLVGRQVIDNVNNSARRVVFDGDIELILPQRGRIDRVKIYLNNVAWIHPSSDDRLVTTQGGVTVPVNEYLLHHNVSNLTMHTTYDSTNLPGDDYDVDIDIKWYGLSGVLHESIIRLQFLPPTQLEQIEPEGGNLVEASNNTLGSIDYQVTYNKNSVDLPMPNTNNNAENELVLALNNSNVNDNNNSILANAQSNGVTRLASGKGNIFARVGMINNLGLTAGTYWHATVGVGNANKAVEKLLPVPFEVLWDLQDRQRKINAKEIEYLSVEPFDVDEVSGSALKLQLRSARTGNHHYYLLVVNQLGVKLPWMIPGFVEASPPFAFRDPANDVQYTLYEVKYPKTMNTANLYFVTMDADAVWKHTIGLTQTGQLFCTGKGTASNLPCGAALGPDVSSFTQISGAAGEQSKIVDVLATNYATFILYADGTVWGMGNNGNNGEDHLGLSTPGAFGTFTQLTLPTLAPGEQVVRFVHNGDANVGDTVSLIVEGTTPTGGKYSRVIAWGQNIVGATGTIPMDVTPLGQDVVDFINVNGITDYKVKDSHEPGMFNIEGFGKYLSNAVVFWVMWNKPKLLLKTSV